MIYVSKLNFFSDSIEKKINEIYDKCDFSKGMMSKNFLGHEIKNNLEIESSDQYHLLGTRIMEDLIFKDINFMRIALPQKRSSYIFSEYLPGMYYDTHQDNSYMGSCRTDWSCTVALNNCSEYEGGELMIDIGDREIPYKLNAGEYVLYPTGMTHRVNKVTSGKRRVCVFWIQSKITDSRIRSVLMDIEHIQQKYYDSWIDDHWLSNKIGKIKYSLTREFGG
jgi:PKHD-type hydroxylase